MKRSINQIVIFCIASLFLLSACSSKTNNSEVSSGTSEPSDTSSPETLEQQLKSTLDYKDADSSASILYFYAGDFENNGQMEAFAFVGDPKSVINEMEPMLADIWYVDKSGAKKILEGKGYGISPEVTMSKNKIILIADENYGLSVSKSHAFTVTDGNPVELENTGKT